MADALRAITDLPTPFNMVVLVVLIGSMAGIVSAAIKQAGKYARHRQELEFKRELLDRGLSAEEVERVVMARSEATGGQPSVVHAGQYIAGDD